ncbi:MAG TPA: dihydrolipoyl dehydrogenase [Acidimicrobiia bacterium]|nr:dihydrolipoyl dehydrogenase [Acidimicrobiia bacterium]
MAEQFDVVIVGGGPGGYAAALYGAAAGLHVAMIEAERVGGTCLHRGCIPAKELLQTAEVLRTVGSAKDFGVDAGEPSLDLTVSQARKHQVIDKLTRGLETLLKGRKVTVIPGTANVVDAGARHVRVSDGSELRGDALILATGSVPRALPGIDFDGHQVLSSDDVLEISEVPARVAIIGGGAIGCEFASLLADYGSEVTLVEALPRLLVGVDPDAARVVERSFKRRGITIHTGAKVRGVDPGPEATLRFEIDTGGTQLAVDRVIVSVGRRPRSEGIGLEESGIALDRGSIVVDDHLRTSIDGVYAVGDVVPTPQLAHVAFSEAIVAIRTILGEPVAPIAYDRVPWGIYCHPEVAFCGLTEEDATERGYDVVTKTERFGGNSRAMIMGEADGLVKIVTERDGPILGVHIVGPWATELLAEGYLAVNWEATPADLAPLIHPHPTLGEVFGETALALTGRALHG